MSTIKKILTLIITLGIFATWSCTVDDSATDEPAQTGDSTNADEQDITTGGQNTITDDGSYVFNIHFAVLTDNSRFQNSTKDLFLREVEILNEFFVSENRDKIVTFQYLSHSLWNDVKDSSCGLVNAVNSHGSYDEWVTLFNACDDPKVRNQNAINFFIYDSYTATAGAADQTSHGRRNSNKPYVFIDYERLDHTLQSPEEHEMGHAFGLEHVCVPGATTSTSTNIMASAGDCDGSGGLRDIGFNADQVQIIKSYAELIYNQLGNN